jgi:hypothetical protein
VRASGYFWDDPTHLIKLPGFFKKIIFMALVGGGEGRSGRVQLYGYALLSLCFLFFAYFSYAIVLSKIFMPPADSVRMTWGSFRFINSIQRLGIAANDRARSILRSLEHSSHSCGNLCHLSKLAWIKVFSP